MKYSDWNKLDNDERKNTAWYSHPHIRTAKIFAAVFVFIFIVVLLGINKNSTVHLNKKPAANEAFIMAKYFVKDNLKQPNNAVFSNRNFIHNITNNSYQISSFVKIEDTTGKMNRLKWTVKMDYTGGDWSDKSSWHASLISIQK